MCGTLHIAFLTHFSYEMIVSSLFDKSRKKTYIYENTVVLRIWELIFQNENFMIIYSLFVQNREI